MSRPNIHDAWGQIFHDFNILQHIYAHSYFVISSQDINNYHEARLMTKFDSSAQLIQIFKENDLAILPTTRGSYVIGYFDAYTRLKYPSSPPIEVIPPNCQSLDYTNLYSESSALSFAFNSGIIDDVMGGNTALYTINGRMSSGVFRFNINNTKICNNNYEILVQNSQIEIDAGYENNDMLCIVEAKNIAPEDFLTRQLFYPYRLWHTKVSKPILCVFLVYSNDIFTAFKYLFSDSKNYNSIQLIEAKRYTIASEPITISDLTLILEKVRIAKEPDIPFPQANSFERVIDFLSILTEHDLSRDETTARYEFNERQTNYYSDACRYLDLVEKYIDEGVIMYRLTDIAKRIMTLNHREKTLELIQVLLSRYVFYRAFQLAIENANLPTNQQLIDIFLQANLAIPLNDTTIKRRASTVRKWTEWILNQCE